jgi:hypothetical protein
VFVVWISLFCCEGLHIPSPPVKIQRGNYVFVVLHFYQTKSIPSLSVWADTLMEAIFCEMLIEANEGESNKQSI